jgi:hypothetical protein
MFGKDSKKKELIKNIDALYGQLQREHQISLGDFPDIKKLQEVGNLALRLEYGSVRSPPILFSGFTASRLYKIQGTRQEAS